MLNAYRHYRPYFYALFGLFIMHILHDTRHAVHTRSGNTRTKLLREFFFCFYLHTLTPSPTIYLHQGLTGSGDESFYFPNLSLFSLFHATFGVGMRRFSLSDMISTTMGGSTFLQDHHLRFRTFVLIVLIRGEGLWACNSLFYLYITGLEIYTGI